MSVVLLILNRVTSPLFPLVIMASWSCGMGIKDRRPLPPRSEQGERACPSMRWNGGWTLKCSWMSTHIGRWGLHFPLILQEIFLQAAHSGRKKAECMICQGHHHGLPCLDLQADISAVQAEGPQTSREEIRDLYYQVYKLWRLPGSPLCGPEQMEELVGDMVSSLKNCLRWKGGQPPRGLE